MFYAMWTTLLIRIGLSLHEYYLKLLFFSFNSDVGLKKIIIFRICSGAKILKNTCQNIARAYSQNNMGILGITQWQWLGL